MMDVIVIDP